MFGKEVMKKLTFAQSGVALRSRFTPLWTKVTFSMTSLPNITAPRRPPPAGVLTDLLPKKWILGQLLPPPSPYFTF